MTDRQVRNVPSHEGRALGKELARLHDLAEPAILAKFPDHAKRCASCAFRAGTYPNGCATTTMDALKAVIEGKPFWCHHDCTADGEPTALCAGWAVAVSEIDAKSRERLTPLTADWEFSK